MTKEPRKVNLGRHQRNCSVCAHKQCERIEADFVSWRSAAQIATEYGLSDRASVYRHAHALNLFEKRKRNIKAALEQIIEKAGEVDVTASAVVQAIQAYTKINAAGQWIERSEQVSLNDLFDKMSNQELDEYARDGTLPAWFQVTTPNRNTGERSE
jgi:phage terminase small subunit